MAKKIATFSERMRIAEILKKHCRSVNGWAQYDEGWSDERVAVESDLDGYTRSVASVRGAIIGKLRERRVSSDLEKRLTQIEDYLTRMDSNWRKP